MTLSLLLDESLLFEDDGYFITVVLFLDPRGGLDFPSCNPTSESAGYNLLLSL